MHYFGLGVYLIHFFSYFYTSLANPGIPNRKYSCENIRTVDTIKKNLKICDYCNIVMDPDKKMVHCEDCGVCIEGKFIV